MSSIRSSLIHRWHRHEKLRFVIVGGWNTVFGYATFAILYGFLHERVNYLAIAVMAHAIAVVNAFVCHRLLVFKRRGSWLSTFARFNFSQITVGAIGLVGLWVLVSICRMNPLTAQLLLTVFTVVLSYLAHRHFSFIGSP